MTWSIYADLRCLQDPRFQRRGIGYHVASLLRSRPKDDSAAWRVVGLIDDSLGDLPPEYAALADEVTRASNVTVSEDGALFLDCSPMTHDPMFSLQLTSHAALLKATIIYDFIPFDWPGYLPNQAARIEYLARLARLRTFNFYLPISHYSADRLSEIVGVSHSAITITGVSVRNSFYDAGPKSFLPSPYEQPNPYFFCLGGGDRRKNTETAVAAVRRLNESQSKKFALKVVGHYDPAYKSDLLRAAGHPEGEGFLELLTDVKDGVLAELYAGSIATIVPSYIEGFSLPVAEAAVCGSPVIASVCGAHMELITESEATFAPDSHKDLADKLSRIVRDADWRAELLASQASTAQEFHEARVGARFWHALEKRFAARVLSQGVRKPRRPKLAFLTPYPPDQSGVARYSQLTIEAASECCDVDLYTNAPRPIATIGFRDAGSIGMAALVKGDYNAVISVLGNSDFHTPVFEVFERFGGPCILHDSRLTQIYFFRLGEKRFLQFASSILGRPVGLGEAELWLQDKEFPSLFVEPVLKRARPLIVHTHQLQKLLRERYGVHAEVTTCCPNMQFSDEELTCHCRAVARKTLGIPPDAFLVSTFGFVGKAKGMEACVLAAEMLRSWNIPAELHFVGDAFGEESELKRIAEESGVAQHVHWVSGFVDEKTYRNFFLASDAAVQLRGYDLGQYSAALGDCISAALPCVATQELAASCEAPDYVRTIPNHKSPLQLAEQLAAIFENGTQVASRMEARKAYLAVHNFRYYVKRLREILNL